MNFGYGISSDFCDQVCDSVKYIDGAMFNMQYSNGWILGGKLKEKYGTRFSK